MRLTYNRKIGASILRFMLGFLMFKDFLIYFINKNYLFDKKGIVSYDIYTDNIKYYHLQWLYIDFSNHKNLILFCLLGIVFSFLFMIGVMQRISVVVLCYLLLIVKMRNIYMLDGADNVTWVILPFFFFINTDSFIKKYNDLKERRFKGIWNPSNTISEYFCYAIMIQICIVYFFSGMHKLQGPLWIDGTALYYILNSDDFSPTKLNMLFTQCMPMVKFSTWLTIAFQIGFPFLVFFKKTRMLALLMGLLFHIGVFLFMRIDNFSLIMIACYAIFIEDRFYQTAFQKLNIAYVN